MNFENKIVTIKPVDSLSFIKKQMSTTSKKQIALRSYYVLVNEYKTRVNQIFYESLILAQDERWRRA